MSWPLEVQRRDDGVAVLTFTDADRRNRMGDALTAAWSAAIDELRVDAALRAVVVAGSGSTFLSGADLGDLADLHTTAARDHLAAFYRAWLGVRDLPVPTIAAMTGHAVGAGLVLALACDLRYAHLGSKYALPFVRLGLHPGEGATALVPEAVGPQRARDLLLTGRTITGEQAAAYGLALEAVDDPLAAALDTATRIATAAPVAVRLAKQGLAPHRADLDAALRWELLAQPVTTATDDFAVGIEAARTHTTPAFHGH